MDNFKAISLSHKGAPLKVRELFTFDESSCKRLLKYFKEYTDLRDVLVLSTCNRTEIYYSSDNQHTGHLLKLIGIEKGLSKIENFIRYFVTYSNHDDAVRHLFKVAVGLDSQVLGDKQIPHQVKKAYQWSVDEDMAGPFLHRLLHTLFFTNKKIGQETSFRAVGTSVASVTCELLEDLKIKRKHPSILILGLGKIGSDLCTRLSKLDYENVMLINRTPEKATVLGHDYGFKSRPLSQLIPAIREADIVISTVSSEKPLITNRIIEEVGSIAENKYLIDLSVPRSIASDIACIPKLHVYNLDTLKERANKVQASIESAVPTVESIIASSISGFNQWCKTMEYAPAIHKFKDILEKIRQEEIARHLKNLTQDEKDAIENISRGMVQKIVKLPVLQLRTACRRGESLTMLGALIDLFDLEKEEYVDLIEGKPLNR